MAGKIRGMWDGKPGIKKRPGEDRALERAFKGGQPRRGAAEGP